MKQFFKYLLASLTALFLFCIIVFFIFGALLGSAFQKEVATVKSNSVLKIEFSQPLDERTDNNPFKNLNLASLKPSNQPGLNDITKCLENAAADANIKGVLLNLNYLEGGYASIRELRNALIEFKKSKKYVIAYSEGYSTKAYYLASVADKVYLHPQGAVDFRGLFTQLVFFKGALEKLEIEPEIIRHGKFKSAIEPFILDKMSPENREQTSTYVNAIWETLCSEIAESRNISRADLENIADSLTAENANDALKLRLVDQLTYQDELDKIIATRNGDEKDKINFVSLVKYKDVPAPKSDKKFTQDRIAVIYATGEIVSGKGERGQMGSDNIAAAIKKSTRRQQSEGYCITCKFSRWKCTCFRCNLERNQISQRGKTIYSKYGRCCCFRWILHQLPGRHHCRTTQHHYRFHWCVWSADECTKTADQ
ncbi:MAG: signal peptide peptidase SppA, 67K type [Bacteroidetes bacterium OLB10]|nr:MAG: signal peptide peptidase SppA, 67K type [Bacteroidetes bacterium OLB10]